MTAPRFVCLVGCERFRDDFVAAVERCVSFPADVSMSMVVTDLVQRWQNPLGGAFVFDESAVLLCSQIAQMQGQDPGRMVLLCDQVPAGLPAEMCVLSRDAQVSEVFGALGLVAPAAATAPAAPAVAPAAPAAAPAAPAPAADGWTVPSVDSAAGSAVAGSAAWAEPQVASSDVSVTSAVPAAPVAPVPPAAQPEHPQPQPAPAPAPAAPTAPAAQPEYPQSQPAPVAPTSTMPVSVPPETSTPPTSPTVPTVQPAQPEQTGTTSVPDLIPPSAPRAPHNPVLTMPPPAVTAAAQPAQYPTSSQTYTQPPEIPAAAEPASEPATAPEPELEPAAADMWTAPPSPELLANSIPSMPEDEVEDPLLRHIENTETAETAETTTGTVPDMDLLAPAHIEEHTTPEQAPAEPPQPAPIPAAPPTPAVPAAPPAPIPAAPPAPPAPIPAAPPQPATPPPPAPIPAAPPTPAVPTALPPQPAPPTPSTAAPPTAPPQPPPAPIPATPPTAPPLPPTAPIPPAPPTPQPLPSTAPPAPTAPIPTTPPPPLPPTAPIPPAPPTPPPAPIPPTPPPLPPTAPPTAPPQPYPPQPAQPAQHTQTPTTIDFGQLNLNEDQYSPDVFKKGEYQHRPTGQAIGVLAAKGGIGKTTLTMWVAEAMYRASGGSVAVVDANLDNPTVLYHTEYWAKTPGIAGLLPREGGDRPSHTQIDETMVSVEGLGSLLGCSQMHPNVTPQRVAPLLCYVIAYLRTKFAWVFVDLPVAGTETTMLTDFALKSDVIDHYLAVFSTENSDIMSVSSWFYQQFKPPEQGGVSLDPKKCRAIINKSDATQLETEPLQKKITERLGMGVVGHVPVAENYARLKNDGKWQCPPELRSYIAEICHNAFGVTLNTPSGDIQSKQSKKMGFRRRKKARRAD